MQQPKLPQLDNRLSLIASMVRPGSIFADIGTDHGYLPVALVGEGICPGGYACDIRPLPLKKAQTLIAACGMSSRIHTLLTDGLQGLENKGVQEIIIAGMGGELIASILDAAAFVRSPDLRLILQPMTRAEQLREYLCTHGFTILREEGVLSGRFIYSVMNVQYTGQNEGDTLFYYVGRMPESRSPDSVRYLQKVLQILRQKQQGLTKASNPSGLAELNQLIARIEAVIPKEETP